MGNTNLWRFFMPCRGHAKLYKNGWEKRLHALEAQLTEEENLEIVRMVKAVRMDNKELTAFLKAYASGLITLPDGMMEAEAAADPDDADVEGMEDGEDEA